MVSEGSILVTGAAGFIGFHTCERLLTLGVTVIGLDNLNDYYDVGLKQARLDILRNFENFRFVEGDVCDGQLLAGLLASGPKAVIHLAAQAGVRYSLEHPEAYVHSNLVGFGTVLEACRRFEVGHLLYASSSSVYGGNSKVPFSEGDPVDHPVSFYAATKRSNEIMADSYSHLYKLPATGLRFFTVYGPWGRPDMAYFSFTDAFFGNRVISVYSGENGEDLSRDFTYVDDVVDSVLALIALAPSGNRPHRILNIGGSSPIKLQRFISTLEESLTEVLGRHAEFAKIHEGMKPGDVPVTFADPSELVRLVGSKPGTALKDGLKRFAEWYVSYYQPGV
ncbi:MAG: NAD-dependent epimerase/dehydratase family protein [Propionibacteriaceae bacterium]|nr:NAD-dependent epimerase/dehydratase family protein [Propionibacteriaceae bacterium]